MSCLCILILRESREGKKKDCRVELVELVVVVNNE